MDVLGEGVLFLDVQKTLHQHISGKPGGSRQRRSRNCAEHRSLCDHRAPSKFQHAAIGQRESEALKVAEDSAIMPFVIRREEVS